MTKKLNTLSKKSARLKELGASLTEYGLLVALVAVVGLPSVGKLGTSVKCSYDVANYAFSQAQQNLPFAPTSHLMANCNKGYRPSYH